MAETPGGPQNEERASERENYRGVKPEAGLPRLPVTNRNLWFVALQAAFFLFGAVVIPLSLIFPYEGERLDFWLTMFFGLMWLASVGALIRCLRIGLTVTEAGLIARHWHRTEFLPWSEIEAVKVRQIETMTPAGPMLHWMIAIHVRPGGWMMLDVLRGERLAQRVCPELELLRKRLGSTPSTSPRTVDDRNLLHKNRRVGILGRIAEHRIRSLERKQSRERWPT